MTGAGIDHFDSGDITPGDAIEAIPRPGGGGARVQVLESRAVQFGDQIPFRVEDLNIS